MSNEKPAEARYTLTLTSEQLAILNRALDVYSRLHAGQFDVITSDVYIYNPPAEGESQQAFYARRDRLAAQLRAVEPLMTHLDPGAFHGIDSPAISDNARVAYDILKVIRYLRFVENGSRQPNVYGYAPRQSSGEPLPRLQAVEESEEGE